MAATEETSDFSNLWRSEAKKLNSAARWRLRRSTHTGGIATDHGATATAARSTPRAPLDPQVDGGADAAAPLESSKSYDKSERLLSICESDRIAGGRQLRQLQRSQPDATPTPSPRLKTALAEASPACRTSQLRPCTAPIAPSRAQQQKQHSLSPS